ncbi:UDP-N-acetylglucosamine 2-epimerase (non-hydrolyzing) [Pacificimonas sp. WHA3]|uniref:UDP-N-acetylglucosamine 2-epimerase (non-hydrolyzing) n=1 Tax=Pacificimonas pallii TaxID=2827236 RepID=A0ABS6SI16_9SPHN|nr:UDP-N-acetylglucosamine 2-epimerase (non-hydrolyzing) [Pacificimonas pallii]MBV7257566.1 UDP-N-acetylglucosamine 2-epimerase (non-hydrolyzing) [Pacificimonas pallii]
MGTRPEAIKLAPVYLALRARGAGARIYDTGQHPDLLPSALAAFAIPDTAVQRSPQRGVSAPLKMLPDMQRMLRAHAPGGVIVQGDTASAFAGALAGVLSGLPVHHVEAGLRSGDWLSPFPEEFIRAGIGRLSAQHFAPTPLAGRNLAAEGIAADRIHIAGNTIVDALRLILPGRNQRKRTRPSQSAGGKLVVLTVHRRESEGAGTRAILGAAAELARRRDVHVIYPAHPRTTTDELAALGSGHGIEVVPPIPYADFVQLLARADLAITDSGGVQEEAAILGTPLICCRNVTERPEALAGTHARLVGTDPEAILAAAEQFLDDGQRPAFSAAFGDGHAADRIAAILTA